MKFRPKLKKKMIGNIVVGAVILLFIVISLVVYYSNADSAFNQFINNTIGKFFNIVAFFENNYEYIVQSAVIVFFLWIISKVLNFLIFLLTKMGKKPATLGIIVSSVIKYGTVLIAIFMILRAWGVETTTLLAGAGILGLALSFGAQSLIEDVISGLFIIFENDFSVGDIIEVDGFRGTVIAIGIRTTKLEDLSGDVKILNNSDIRGAVNTSNNLHPAICDLSVSYSTDLQKFEKLIREELPKIKDTIPDIMEGPYYRGVQELGESAVVLRIVARTEEMKKYQVVRDLNRELKLFCDKHGFEIPFNQMVIHMDKEEPAVKKPVQRVAPAIIPLDQPKPVETKAVAKSKEAAETPVLKNVKKTDETEKIPTQKGKKVEKEIPVK
jgi:small conductance mechanosensitive channel